MDTVHQCSVQLVKIQCSFLTIQSFSRKEQFPAEECSVQLVMIQCSFFNNSELLQTGTILPTGTITQPHLSCRNVHHVFHVAVLCCIVLVHCLIRNLKYRMKVLVKKLFSENFLKIFLSVEPGWPGSKKNRRSSNFTFTMITFRIGPFRNFLNKKIFSKNFFLKNFLSVEPGWPGSKKISKVFKFHFYYDNFSNWTI